MRLPRSRKNEVAFDNMKDDDLCDLFEARRPFLHLDLTVQFDEICSFTELDRQLNHLSEKDEDFHVEIDIKLHLFFEKHLTND